MEKIITKIVTQILSKLTKDRVYYTQKDLSDYGFPQFLIKRITFHLVRELGSEFNLPGEEWLNRESDELLAEWAELQRTIKREIHLPAYLAEEIVEKSVRECVGMTLQPPKVIPELLFEESAELDSNQLTERSSAISVNRFLVWSMVRYMEKKNRESLNITDATRILESIENKIVENYHPLNWLSLVKPLYELSGSTVHSDLLRRFFENKGINHLAKEFDLIDGEIKESRFIEILSSPNSIRVEGYKDDQQTLFQEKGNEDKIESEEPNEDLIENQEEMSEDLSSDNTPIFQSFREDPTQEPDEWDEDDEEDVEEEQASDLDEDVEEEQISKSEMSAEEEQASDLEEELETEPKEDFEEEQASEPDEEDEEEQEFILEEDVEEEQASKSEMSVEDEPVSDLEEDDVKADIQDEELKAPWDEEEENDFTFITHDDIEDSPVSELQNLYKEEQEEVADEEGQEGVIDEGELEGVDDNESGTFKSDEPASDAALLEIDDEDEALNSTFESKQDQNESILESDEDDLDESEQDEESEASILEVDSDSDSDAVSDGEDSSLLNRFMFDESDTEDSLGSMESDGDKKVTTIYDELNLVRNDSKPQTIDLFGSIQTPEAGKKTSRLKLDDKSSGSETEESGTIRKFSDVEESESEKDSNDTEVPMWRSFLEREENETKSVFQFDDDSVGDEEELDIEDSDEKLDEDGFIEEPIYDFTKKEVDLDEKIGDLSNWMKDVREKFIEELFGDSEDAYEQALSDIMEFDEWKKASKYIEKEIFTRNRIDVYDEIAVDFTDRLHSYFIENKS